MVDVKVPVLAESVSEATLMTWHKKQGDVVKRGDNLIDIETDKVTLEVAALSDGILSEILKGDGELVQSDEVIARISTAEKSEKPVAKKKPDIPEQQSLPVEDTSENYPKTSPAVRNLLSENNLKSSDIPDSNADGRITKEDVVNYIDGKENPVVVTETSVSLPAEIASKTIESVPVEITKPVAQTQKPESDPVTAPKVNLQGRLEEKVAMSRLRQRTAERLMAAQHDNAILTTFNEVNMKPVMDLRAQYKVQFEKEHGVKLGFMSFFTKASTEALKKFPVINASIDGKDIVYHGYFDIGIAVSATRGLVVPIIRNADTMSFAEIEAKVAEYGQKARDSKLTIDELTGGTFTITNGGTFGSLLSTPILNPPQSAILGMHKIQDRPMAVNGEVVILPIMYLALSYDHRIIDGRDAVQFLVTIKDLLEDPSRLLLQV
ncbi:MAG: 2-oxoglutarate dehydrogenase E2 component (dihydrolipoamide succinyltransferase) [Gammaproteobacteria bacterium]|jgi:2-oxoglutarate dehydrogenase E2 component (dihydrolipoamide succinyltransferase)